MVRALAAASGRHPTESDEKNAYRIADRLIEHHDLALPIPVQEMQHEIVKGLHRQISTYHVRPQSWISHLVAEDPRLLGGVNGNLQENCSSFWQMYRLQHGTHAVFQEHGDNLSRVLPIFLHGDEGRGKRKTGYMVLSFETPFGSTAHSNRACHCAQFMQDRPHLPTFGTCNPELVDPAVVACCRKMYTNYKGHSYLSRFLLFGLGKTVYKDNPHVITTLMETAARDFTELFYQGISFEGKQIYGAVVGTKGDLDFHTIYYSLNRSYSKVMVRGGAGYICHLCHAASGSFDPTDACPSFEDFSESPQWRHTLHATRPWAAEPALAGIPFDSSGILERALVPDTLHVIKLGLARDLIGGCVILLMRKKFFDHEGSTRNLDDRLARAYSMFLLYTQVTKQRPALRGFTRQFFHYKSQSTAPYTNSKASDSIILLRWLVWFLKLNLSQPAVPGFSKLLRSMPVVCEAVLDLFQIIHSHNLFLERPCAARLYVVMMRILRGYKSLGRQALGMFVHAFLLKPKAHSLHHLAYSIRSWLETGAPLVLNPEATSCETNEDFVGRVSRLARRVGSMLVDRRVLQRVFLKTRALHKHRRRKGT